MERLRLIAKVTQGSIPCPSRPAFFPLLHSVFQKLETNLEEKQDEVSSGQEHGNSIKILSFKKELKYLSSTSKLLLFWEVDWSEILDQ